MWFSNRRNEESSSGWRVGKKSSASVHLILLNKVEFFNYVHRYCLAEREVNFLGLLLNI